mgnify:CR=1 FL=1
MKFKKGNFHLKALKDLDNALISHGHQFYQTIYAISSKTDRMTTNHILVFAQLSEDTLLKEQVMIF